MISLKNAEMASLSVAMAISGSPRKLSFEHFLTIVVTFDWTINLKIISESNRKSMWYSRKGYAPELEISLPIERTGFSSLCLNFLVFSTERLSGTISECENQWYLSKNSAAAPDFGDHQIKFRFFFVFNRLSLRHLRL